jgi:thioesterase domain-containing protein
LQKESPMFSDPGHFKAPNAFEQFLNRFSNYILQHSPGFFTPSNQLQDMDNTISEALKNLEAHYSKIIKTYNPEPYLRKVVLFKAQEFPPPGMLLEPPLCWILLARGGVEVHTIPGHHTSIVETQELAEKLQNCIKEAQFGQG